MTRGPRDPNRAGKADHAPKPAGSLTTRLLWFVVLWLAGLAAVSALALAIRAVLR